MPQTTSTAVARRCTSAPPDGSEPVAIENHVHPLSDFFTAAGEAALTACEMEERFVDADWVVATNTPEEERTDAQRRTLAFSDDLVQELMAADILVIGAPIYNFSVPASLKAWIDLIARVRLTFQYTAQGPVGLLDGKKAYVLTPSGGVPVGSAVDFATPYLRHALGFVGITDVNFIGAQGADRGNDQALDEARARIAELVHLETKAA